MNRVALHDSPMLSINVRSNLSPRSRTLLHTYLNYNSNMLVGTILHAKTSDTVHKSILLHVQYMYNMTVCPLTFFDL